MTITFPLGLFLLPYALVIAIVFGTALFAFYHFIHFGATTRASFLAASLWVIGTALILLVTFNTVSGTDWKYPLSFGLSLGTFTFSPPQP